MSCVLSWWSFSRMLDDGFLKRYFCICLMVRMGWTILYFVSLTPKLLKKMQVSVITWFWHTRQFFRGANCSSRQLPFEFGWRPFAYFRVKVSHCKIEKRYGIIICWRFIYTLWFLLGFLLKIFKKLIYSICSRINDD